MQSKTSAAGSLLAVALALTLLVPAASAQSANLAIVLTHSGSSTAVTEGTEAADTYTVALSRAPLGPVTVALTFAGADFAVTPSSVSFSPADTAPKTITVTSADDDVAEGTEVLGITHTTSSAVPAESGRTAVLTLRVLDNDPGIGLAATGGSTRVTEASGTGRSDTLDVSLGTRPGAGVTLTFASNEQVTVSPTKLIFTNSDWSSPKTLTVTAIDDRVDDDALAGLVTVTAASTGAYNGVAASLPVQVVDNDRAGYVFNALARDTLPGPFALDEDSLGTPATFTLKLASQPTAPVTVDLLHDATQVSVTPASLTFNPTGTSLWSTARTVTITLLADRVDEAGTSSCPSGPLPGQTASCDLTYEVLVTPSATTTDAKYANAPGPLRLDVADNDNAAYQFATATGEFGSLSSLGRLALSEASPQPTTYRVRLASQPTGPVTLGLAAPGGQVQVAPATLTFTQDGATAWDQPQTVTVTLVQDFIDEADTHATAVEHSATTTDALYQTVPGPLGVDIADDDTAGLQLVPEAGSGPCGDPPSECVVVREGAAPGEPGGAGTLVLELQSRPTATVTATLSVADADQIVLSRTSVTLQPADWDVDQPVLVTAVDDAIAETAADGLVIVTAALSSEDPLYDGLAADETVHVVDDDGKGILNAGNGLTVTEGSGSDTYTLRLVENPTTPVTVSVTSQAGKLRFNGAATLSLTFAPTTLPGDAATPGTTPWNVPQTVTVSAPRDNVAQGLHADLVRHAVSGGGPAYAGATIASLPAVLRDGDKGLLLGLGDGLGFVEGGSDTFTVALSVEPESSVAVELTPAAGLAVSEPTLYFGSEDWSVPQTVTLSAPDDDVDEATAGLSVAFTLVGLPGDGYDGLAVPPVPVTVGDDDQVGFVVDDEDRAIALEEGQSAFPTVALASQPLADVTIALSSPDDAVAVSPPTLTFTPATWATPQAVTVEAVDDDVAGAGVALALGWSTSSADAAYAALPDVDLLVTVTEDDAVGFVVEPAGGLQLEERFTPLSGQYTVALTSQPLSDVALHAAFDAAQVDVTPLMLTFTPENWQTAQAFAVTPVNDGYVEGPHTVTLGHTVLSGDAAYAALAAPQVAVAIADNDEVGLTVGQSGGSTAVTEGSGNDVVRVRLKAIPAQDVVVHLVAGPGLAASPADLTFTPGTWDALQTVRVTAVDDSAVQGARTSSLGFATTSLDAAWDGLTAPGVTVDIAEDDAIAVLVDHSGGSTLVTEGGNGDTVRLRLASQPAADVTVGVAPDGQLRLGATTSVVFTPDNWATFQAVFVRAFNDGVAEGPHAGSLAFQVASADPLYEGLPVAAFTVPVADND